MSFPFKILGEASEWSGFAGRSYMYIFVASWSTYDGVGEIQAAKIRWNKHDPISSQRRDEINKSTSKREERYKISNNAKTMSRHNKSSFKFSEADLRSQTKAKQPQSTYTYKS